MTHRDALPRARLDRRRREAVQLLAAGRNNRAAAQELGLSEATIRRWRAEPEFVAVLDEAFEIVAAEGQRRLKGMVNAAVDRVAYLMEHGGRDDRVQLEAAMGVIAHVYGQPARRTQVSGPGDGPVQHQVVTVHIDPSAPREDRYRIVQAPPER